MSDTDHRNRCVLGLACEPGSAAQRRALHSWLLERLCKLLLPVPEKPEGGEEDEELTAMVGEWLDELPWDPSSVFSGGERGAAK